MSVNATFARTGPVAPLEDPVVAWHVEGNVLAATLQDGDALAVAVQRLLRQLPQGPLTLLARGPFGLAIAAAGAASRSDPTRWQEIHLSRELSPSAHPLILVEAVELGGGMRKMLAKRYPQVAIVDGLAQAPAAETLAA